MTINSSRSLTQYIAQAVYCSRRQATELIKQGKVKINGTIITVPFHHVSEYDLVTAQGQQITLAQRIYILFNKPKNLVCTASDDKGRKTVTDVFTPYFAERLYPVGRLDRATTGLLIITNDGQLTQKLTHPKYEVKKTYKVTADRNITKNSLDQLLKGMKLEDGFMKVDEAYYAQETKRSIYVTIHSGKNQIVRRLCKELGYEDIKLDRVQYAGLTKKDLPVGAWRHLTKEEVAILQEQQAQPVLQQKKKVNRAKKYYARL